MNSISNESKSYFFMIPNECNSFFEIKYGGIIPVFKIMGNHSPEGPVRPHPRWKVSFPFTAQVF